MRRILTVAFWTAFVLTSFACFAIAVVLWVVTAPFDRRRTINHLWSSAWATIYAVIYPGWDVSFKDRHKIEPKKAYVLIANHTSIVDIVLLFGLFKQFKWVSKREVFKAPLIGWNMWLSGYVPLVRGQATSIAKMMEDCRLWLRRGISVMMFPEGTRSEDGKLRPFKHGAFSLAMENQVPVVPIAIHGGHALMAKHGSTFATKAKLVIEVLDPVPCEGFSDPSVYAEACRHKIQVALARGAMAEAQAEASASEARGELDLVPSLEPLKAQPGHAHQSETEHLAGR